MKIFREVVAALAFAILPVSAFAQADSFPSKPVRLVVSFAAGGVSDIVGRVVAQRMTEFLGQTVLVENRPGGNGAIGAVAVAKAPPDGLTLGNRNFNRH